MAKKKLESRRRCGTCRWYDALGDLCRNSASPHEWENMDPRDKCKMWEKDK